jgi:hypothetical protein
MARTICLWTFQVLMTVGNLTAQVTAENMPTIVEKGGRHTLLVDGKPFFIFGGQAHNSSAWPAMLPLVWTAIEEMHANTLEIPIYWEQVESLPGKYDFSLVDTLLLQSRRHEVRLVLLWFASWKNGSNHYMPGWMKKDAVRYPNITRQNGKPADSPSPHAEDALEADRRAFAAVMRHLKRADPQHTVIMVQVENEPGSWGSVRDYSPKAQRLFEGPVPAELLKPTILEALHVPVVSGGSWQKVFADRADEYFHAWSVARYIGQVAAAGKSEYPLPVYVNAALRDPLTNPPATHYESGGPTDNVIPIWKAAAPSIDMVCPDIYLSGSETIMKVLELYDRPDNPLFVPELGISPEYAKWLYAVIARGGIGFSPFGIDDNGQGQPKSETAERLYAFTQEYELLVPMMRKLAKWGSEGKIKVAIEHEDHGEQTIGHGDWQAVVSFGSGKGNAFLPNAKPDGKVLIIELDESRFILIGTGCRISFLPRGKNEGRDWQYAQVEEGRFENGVFTPLRILNGDETDWGGPLFGSRPTVLKAELILR